MEVNPLLDERYRPKMQSARQVFVTMWTPLLNGLKVQQQLHGMSVTNIAYRQPIHKVKLTHKQIQAKAISLIFFAETTYSIITITRVISGVGQASSIQFLAVLLPLHCGQEKAFQLRSTRLINKFIKLLVIICLRLYDS